METTPLEVQKLYAEVRSRMNITKRGQPISRRAEVLALFALDVVVYEGKRMRDAGFTSSVLSRWKQGAQEYGFSGDEYKTKEAVRSALRRVQKQLVNQDRATRPDGPGVVRSGLFW